MVFWNNSPMWLRSQLVIAVGHAIQQQLRDHAWPNDPLLCLSVAAGAMKCDRQVRQCFIEMPLQDSRIASKTSKLLRKVRLTTSFAHGMGRCGVHAEISARTRKHFINGLSYMYTCDKSRKGGKDWLVGNLQEYSAGIIGWCAPVVGSSEFRTTWPAFSEVWGPGF